MESSYGPEVWGTSARTSVMCGRTGACVLADTHAGMVHIPTSMLNASVEIRELNPLSLTPVVFV